MITGRHDLSAAQTYLEIEKKVLAEGRASVTKCIRLFSEYADEVGFLIPSLVDF